MKKIIISILFLGAVFNSNAQWTNTGNNTTTGKVVAKEFSFSRIDYDFSKKPRTQISPMSIKLFDDYVTTRPGGSSPDNNSYGTLLSMYGRNNHWESNIYFGANTKKMYFRTSTWSGGTNENGVKGGFHDWRTLLDSKSDVKTSGLLKVEGDGNHYVSRGSLGIGTKAPKNSLHIKGKENSYSQVLIEGGNGAAIQLESENNIGDRPVISAKDGDLSFQIWRNRGDWKSSPFIVKANGNVGIGETLPKSKLHIKKGVSGATPHGFSTLTVEGSSSEMVSILTPNNKTAYFGFADPEDNYVGGMQYEHVNDRLVFRTNNHNYDLVLNKDGNLGIGTTDTKGFKLGVNGKIAATEVKVATYSNWADFVFKKDYNLPTLSEVENHIKENGHLANIPSAAKVKKDGFFLGEMDAKLLQKIEELTLYTIQQEKDLKNQEVRAKKQSTKIEKLKIENELLKNRLDKIEELLKKLK